MRSSYWFCCVVMCVDWSWIVWDGRLGCLEYFWGKCYGKLVFFLDDRFRKGFYCLIVLICWLYVEYLYLLFDWVSWYFRWIGMVVWFVFFFIILLLMYVCRFVFSVFFFLMLYWMVENGLSFFEMCLYFFDLICWMSCLLKNECNWCFFFDEFIFFFYWLNKRL